MSRRALVCLLLLAGALEHALAFYGSGGSVVELTPSNFDSQIRSGGVWLVEFYAPWCGHCQQLKPAWEQAAGALKGIVNVAAVDANEHPSLGQQYSVQGYPTIKVMYALDGKIQAEDYNGGRSAKELASFALDKAKGFAFRRLGERPPPGGGGGGGGGGSCGGGGGGGSCGGGGGGCGARGGGGGSCGGGGGSCGGGGGGGGGGCGARGGGGGGGGGGDFYSGTDVVTLTDKDFQEEVVDSDGLWMVEFYAPWCGHCKSLKPAWIEAAQQLSGKVKVGAVDCTAHQSTCSEYGVRGYPTIKFFGADKQSPEDYSGGRDSGSIADFATRRWSEQSPPREVRELVDEVIMETECTGVNEPGMEKAAPSQLCFIAFLPDILDTQAAGRNAYLDILRQVASKYKARPFSYLWAEGGKQEALEQGFGVGGFGYPALVAYSPKQQQFSTMRSAFETEHVLAFVEALRHGGERVQALSGELGRVVSVPEWDGQDGQLPAEEEFSLDDIMNS